MTDDNENPPVADQPEAAAAPEAEAPVGAEADAPAEAVAEDAAAPDAPVDPQHVRLFEAILFASPEVVSERALAERLPDGASVKAVLAELQAQYSTRGVHVIHAGGGWAFRTAPDLARVLNAEAKVEKKLSRAALETLATIAYHQPVSRPEIEEIRGVALSKGTLDVLLEAGWIKPRGRRKTPGQPMTWGTTDAFLDHFGLEKIGDLPGVDELKAAGLLDARPALAAYASRGALGDGETLPEPADDEESATPEPLDPEGGEGETPSAEEQAYAESAHDGDEDGDEDGEEGGDKPEAGEGGDADDEDDEDDWDDEDEDEDDDDDDDDDEPEVEKTKAN